MYGGIGRVKDTTVRWLPFLLDSSLRRPGFLPLGFHRGNLSLRLFGNLAANAHREVDRFAWGLCEPKLAPQRSNNHGLIVNANKCRDAAATDEHVNESHSHP